MLETANTTWDIAVYFTGTAVLSASAVLGAALVVASVCAVATRVLVRRATRLYCLPADLHLIRKWHRAGCPVAQMQSNGDLAWTTTRDVSR